MAKENATPPRTRVSAEEMRCLKLLEAHPAEWAWFMTDEEFAIAEKAMERRKTEVEGGAQ